MQPVILGGGQPLANSYRSFRSVTKPAVKPTLDQLRQDHVTRQHNRQQQPVQWRKWDKPERVGEGRNRQQGAHADDYYRSDDEWPTGPALEKRDLVGADDVNDQRLGEERLDEPAGVEQGRVVPAIERAFSSN
jgi:Ni/Co efflux regulator RcnB